MLLFIIILTIFISSSPVNASEFFEYQNNPVVTKTGGSSGIAQPYVSKKGDVFSMWFADVVGGGRVAISHMKSTNGIDWYDKKILSVSNKSTLTDPFMFEDNGEYQLYFASSVGGIYSIWKSTSADGVTFSQNQETQILKPESKYQWERSNVSTPSIMKDNGLYYLFYEGNGSINWSTGLAISTDGVNWEKCINNPLVVGGGAAHIIRYSDVYYLFFHSAQGIQVQQADRLDGCNTTWSNKHIVLTSFSDPSPVQVGNDLWLYGFSNTSAGQTIWLAANTQIQQPSYPVVIIPGMFASWNADALLHNSPVNSNEWKMNPGVSEYSALKQTLSNLGRVENKDYYTFAYDWRKPILETVSDLDAFLTNSFWNTNTYQPVQLVGHSLGGVVSRIYADKNPTKPIKQVVTAGSPLLGSVQTFKPLNSGEIERENTLSWLAMKIILFLNKQLFQSEKDAIAQKLPVLFDILPAFPFLKDASGSFIVSPLTNTLTTLYPIQSSPQIPQYYMGGSGTQTLAGYTPTSSWTEDGDGLVLAKSHLNKISPAPIQNHGEIIYTKESIKNILSKLAIQASEGNIVEGSPTSIFPAIIALIQSPATMQIENGGTTTSENMGLIWLQNINEGEYKLKITGTAEGEYTVSILLIGEASEKWIQLKKQTTNGKIDKYQISFDRESGGEVTEEIIPTPTMAPTLTPTPMPTIKPTAHPTPTKLPHPTKKPTPTKIPPKYNNHHKFTRLLQIIIKNIFSILRKR